MHIRPFRCSDSDALFRVFYSSVHQIACRDYGPEQIDAWAPIDMHREKWHARMTEIAPFVVEIGDNIIAYADVQPTGYIDHFYVSGEHNRMGAGRLLMDAIHEKARHDDMAMLTADVSLTAQPFFAHFGFEIVVQRIQEIRGVVVPNALMRKVL